MTTTAIGLEIGRRKPDWRIGKMIGEGACGAVHLLESMDGSSITTFAIKVAEIPAASVPAKRKKTLKHNSDLLHYENLIYTSHLATLRGRYIPELPPAKGPPSTGEVGGFRYLVMERMEAPFWDIIPRLRNTRKKASIIDVGPIATQLLRICQAVHDTNLLVIDCKPENFMLTAPKKGTPLENTIRMIDLGLMQTYGSPSGHRPNEQGGMVGTPLYSSLNIHQGNTASRRDDLEAIGYVICELCLRIISTNQGDHALPWSAGKSDEEIYKIKDACMSKPKSQLFLALGALGNKKLETIMRKYFSIVRNMTYKQNPDYNSLHDLLADVKVSIDDKVIATPKAKEPKPLTTTLEGTRRTRASKRDVEKEDTEITAKKQHVVEFRHDESMKVESDDETFITTHDDETSFNTCNQGEIEAMEWEIIHDEKPKSSRIGLMVIFTAGPHEGESLILANGERQSVTVGADPSEKDGYSIVGDSEVEKSHVTLVLKATKKLKTILLTDLKSAHGTWVNGSIVKKQQKLFINDSVDIGVSTFKIVPIPEHDLRSPTAKPTPKAILKNDNEKGLASDNVGKGDKGVSLNFTAGPYTGQSIDLVQDVSDTIYFGANPISDASFPMSKDKSITNLSHACFKLETSKTFFTVLVTDLNSTSGTSVNGGKIGKGKQQKAFMNDSIEMGDSALKIVPLSSKTLHNNLNLNSVTIEEAEFAKENKVPSVNTHAERKGVSLVFLAGPYKGESIDLVKGQSESMVLGAMTSSTSSFALTKDKSITNHSHVRFELETAKKFFTVLVTDLKSTGGTSVNGSKMGKGKTQKVFMNDEIEIGSSVVKIKTL